MLLLLRHHFNNTVILKRTESSCSSIKFVLCGTLPLTKILLSTLFLKNVAGNVTDNRLFDYNRLIVTAVDFTYVFDRKTRCVLYELYFAKHGSTIQIYNIVYRPTRWAYVCVTAL